MVQDSGGPPDTCSGGQIHRLESRSPRQVAIRDAHGAQEVGLLVKMKFSESLPLTRFGRPAMYFSGDAMKRSREQFECVVLVDGRVVWKGKRPVKAYPRIRARHLRARISIRWTLKEGTLIASSEISLPYRS